MAEIVVFHHALGRTAGVIALADALGAAGHAVHLPDLFDGRVFDSIEDGVAHVSGIGFDAFIEAGASAVDGLPPDLVYVGISLGVLPAQRLSQTRAGARGSILLESCVPVSEFSEHWPAGVPVQIHGMDADPFFAGEGDIEAARALVAEAASSGTTAELHVYPGDRHLFTDSSIPSHDPDAYAMVVERIVEFLERLP
jgi:dienelactone hydrolase